MSGSGRLPTSKRAPELVCIEVKVQRQSMFNYQSKVRNRTYLGDHISTSMHPNTYTVQVATGLVSVMYSFLSMVLHVKVTGISGRS